MEVLTTKYLGKRSVICLLAIDRVCTNDLRISGNGMEARLSLITRIWKISGHAVLQESLHAGRILTALGNSMLIIFEMIDFKNLVWIQRRYTNGAYRQVLG